MLFDIRHDPNENDIAMKAWLGQQGLPILVIATKADKISRGARPKHITAIRKALKMQADELPICFSAETGEGVNEVLGALNEIMTG